MRKYKILYAISVVALLAIYYSGTRFYNQCNTETEISIFNFFNNEYIKLFLFVLVLALPMLYWLVSSLRSPDRSMWKKIGDIVTFLLILVIPSYVFFIFVFRPYSGIGGGIAHEAYGRIDRGRVRDIQNLPINLELYFDEHKRYPRSLDELVPEYLDKPIADHITGEPLEYIVSEDGQNYVVKTALGITRDNCYDKVVMRPISLSVSKSVALEHDLDGEVLGVDCDDPVYCVGSIDGRLIR